MPEMPEVEGFKKYIADTSLYKKIIDVTSSAKKLIKKTSFKDFKKALIGKKFTSAERKGKYILLTIGGKKLIMHFGLTGSVAYEKDTDKKVEYAKVTFIFEDNSALHWISIRKFGNIWLVDDIGEISSLKTLGPDPLKLSQKQFIETLQNYPQKNIKSCLMDQEMFSGIGNEYSDEILFQASIDPHRNVDDLSTQELKKIYTKMKEVLTYFIQFHKKYSKIRDFQDLYEKKLKPSYLQAHRHGDKKCPKNKKHTLKKATIAGRSAYYCPKDQK